jgi:predicted SAM-dependent methyltransferase
LGCGPDVREGFENLDVRELPGVTFCDVSDPIGMAQYKGAEEILAYDILEHFDRETAYSCLLMWVDLLAPGGIMRIRCPDIVHAVSVRQSDEWLEMLIYGGQDYPENYHKCGFTKKMMLAFLEVLGMNVLSTEQTNAGNMEVVAQR